MKKLSWPKKEICSTLEMREVIKVTTKVVKMSITRDNVINDYFTSI